MSDMFVCRKHLVPQYLLLFGFKLETIDSVGTSDAVQEGFWSDVNNKEKTSARYMRCDKSPYVVCVAVGIQP